MCEILQNTDMKGKPNICHPLLSWRKNCLGMKIGVFLGKVLIWDKVEPLHKGMIFRAEPWNDWNLPGKCCFVHSSNQFSSFFVAPRQLKLGLFSPPGSGSVPSNLVTKQPQNVDSECDTTEVPSKSRASPSWLQRNPWEGAILG